MGVIRTVEHLADALDGDLAWRRRELETWSGALLRTRSHQQEVVLRGAWALLYAHWEGGIKHAATAYLEYVSRLGLQVDELIDPLVAVALRPSLASAAASTHGSAHTQLVSAVRAGQLKANLPFDSATIKTHSNLKFEVFEEILLSVGCDPAPHRDIRDDIDKLLLTRRNDIAHGRYMAVTLDDWEALRAKVVAVLDDVRTQMTNAAIGQTFKRPA